jgi:hypothetical protein
VFFSKYLKCLFLVALIFSYKGEECTFVQFIDKLGSHLPKYGIPSCIFEVGTYLSAETLEDFEVKKSEAF